MTADRSPGHKSPPSYFHTGALGAMLRAPYPESPVLAAAIALAFIVFLPERFTAADTDDDGYHDVRELVNGCDLFDPASFPTCQHGEVVACSTTEPGYTPAPEPC